MRKRRPRATQIATPRPHICATQRSRTSHDTFHVPLFWIELPRQTPAEPPLSSIWETESQHISSPPCFFYSPSREKLPAYLAPSFPSLTERRQDSRAAQHFLFAPATFPAPSGAGAKEMCVCQAGAGASASSI